MRRDKIRPDDQTEQIAQPERRCNDNLFFVCDVDTDGGQRSGDNASDMRNSSNDLRHLSFAESARCYPRICVEAVLVNNK